MVMITIDEETILIYCSLKKNYYHSHTRDVQKKQQQEDRSRKMFVEEVNKISKWPKKKQQTFKRIKLTIHFCDYDSDPMVHQAALKLVEMFPVNLELYYNASDEVMQQIFPQVQQLFRKIAGGGKCRELELMGGVKNERPIRRTILNKKTIVLLHDLLESQGEGFEYVQLMHTMSSNLEQLFSKPLGNGSASCCIEFCRCDLHSSFIQNVKGFKKITFKVCDLHPSFIQNVKGFKEIILGGSNRLLEDQENMQALCECLSSQSCEIESFAFDEFAVFYEFAYNEFAYNEFAYNEFAFDEVSFDEVSSDEDERLDTAINRLALAFQANTSLKQLDFNLRMDSQAQPLWDCLFQNLPCRLASLSVRGNICLNSFLASLLRKEVRSSPAYTTLESITFHLFCYDVTRPTHDDIPLLENLALDFPRLSSINGVALPLRFWYHLGKKKYLSLLPPLDDSTPPSLWPTILANVEQCQERLRKKDKNYHDYWKYHDKKVDEENDYLCYYDEKYLYDDESDYGEIDDDQSDYGKTDDDHNDYLYRRDEKDYLYKKKEHVDEVTASIRFTLLQRLSEVGFFLQPNNDNPPPSEKDKSSLSQSRKRRRSSQSS